MEWKLNHFKELTHSLPHPTSGQIDVPVCRLLYPTYVGQHNVQIPVIV
jgi:hypothetical protein